MSAEEGWVSIQKKTFTKWMNTHLRKKGFPALGDVQTEFESGINLMNLMNALYSVPIPKHNKDPKMRPHKLDNITLALAMVEKAEVKTNFLKNVHLIDHDLKMILGMIWAIILDYQIKGISVEEMTAKEGLLLWCQKKTHGYKDVKVDNFSNSWSNGLAFCALIHRHRPDLLDFDSLSKDNARHNLQLAFDVAEQHLGISPLLDIEDIADVAKPDERSVMTYVSEYFHCFANQDVKERAAHRIQKFVQFNKAIESEEADYEHKAKDLLQWIEDTIRQLEDRHFGATLEEAKAAFESHKQHLAHTKPAKEGEKLDLEAKYAEIQTRLAVYGRVPYNVPHGLSTEDIDAAWDRLEKAQRARGHAVRDNMYRFITKATTSVSDDQIKEFESSFAHFDKNGNGSLDRTEFKAALSALSIPFKDEDTFNKTFDMVSGGSDRITKQQFVDYLISISEDKDTAESLRQAFLLVSDSNEKVSKNQLKVHPLKDNEIDYLAHKMPALASEVYDYPTYVNSSFKDN